MSTNSIRIRYYVITFLVWFATALPLSLTVLLAGARGLSLFEVSFALGVYSLTIVLLEVPTGGLADAVGRKRVALLAFALAALYNLVFLFAFSFPILLLAMILYGVSRALSSGALDAWFVDALQAADPAVDLQPALAGAETVSLLALGLGAVAGGALPRLFAGLPADGTAVLTPLAMPIVAALAVKLLLVAAVALLIREERPAGGASWRAGFRAVPALVREASVLSRANPRLLLLMSASFVAGLAIISLEALWQPFFAALPGVSDGGAPTLLFGVIMAGNFLVGMVGNLLSVPLSRRLGGRYGLVGAISRLLQGASILGLAAAGALFPATGLFWLAYLMGGVGLSPHATLLNAEIPAERRSAMLSVQSLAAYLGSFLGGAGLGYVADHLSISAAWAIAGALTVVSLVPYLMLDARRVRPEDNRGTERLFEQP
ncbi:MFS transporter [Promineifilum sp.]|uniref:MFS transporter n=1 Tax=Promineifilum sp. TaxID=2664178 RepID=UPI0035AF3EFC